MAVAWTRSAARFWRGLKFILIDCTISPRMLMLNEQRPIIYQLVSTPIVTLVFALIAAAAIMSINFRGIWPER